MGDDEIVYLLQHNQLPGQGIQMHSSQQRTIQRCLHSRECCLHVACVCRHAALSGHHRRLARLHLLGEVSVWHQVDQHASVHRGRVRCPASLIESLFARQQRKMERCRADWATRREARGVQLAHRKRRHYVEDREGQEESHNRSTQKKISKAEQRPWRT